MSHGRRGLAADARPSETDARPADACLACLGDADPQDEQASPPEAPGIWLAWAIQWR